MRSTLGDLEELAICFPLDESLTLLGDGIERSELELLVFVGKDLLFLSHALHHGVIDGVGVDLHGDKGGMHMDDLGVDVQVVIGEHRSVDTQFVEGQCASLIGAKHVHACHFFYGSETSHDGLVFSKLGGTEGPEGERKTSFSKPNDVGKQGKKKYIHCHRQHCRHCNGNTTDNQHKDVVHSGTVLSGFYC